MRTIAASSWWKSKVLRRRNQRPIGKRPDGRERLIDDESIRPTPKARTIGRYRELGNREIEMPWGTWLLVVRFHARCEAPPH